MSSLQRSLNRALTRPATSLGWLSSLRLSTAPWGLVLVCVTMLVAGAYQLDRPGLYGDEALQSAPAARIAGLNLPTVDVPHGADRLEVGGRLWPLMAMSYLGPVKTYLLAGSFTLFGVSVQTLRLTTLTVGIIGLAFAYFFLRRALGTKPALAGVLLLGTDTSYIMLTRLDWGPVAIPLALKSAGLYCLIRWWQAGSSRRWAWLLGLALGLGLSHKADFAWLLIAGLPVAVALYWRPLLSRLTQVPWLAAGFVVGALPLLVYNYRSGWITWTLPRTELARQLAEAFPDIPLPLAMLQLAAQRAPKSFSVLAGVLKGETIQRVTLADATVPLGDPKLQALAFLALVGLSGLLLGWRADGLRRAALGTSAMCLGIFLQILVTPSASGPHHSIAVYPFVQLALALGLVAVDSVPRPRLRQAMKGLGWAAVAFIVGINMVQLATYHRLIGEIGGRGQWSTAIYGVADALRNQHPAEVVVTLGWGQRDQLITLLGPQAQVSFAEFDTSNARRTLSNLIGNQRSVFLVDVPDNRLFKDTRESFWDEVNSLRFGRPVLTTFGQEDGTPLYTLVSLPRPEVSLGSLLGNAVLKQPAGNTPPIAWTVETLAGDKRAGLLQHPTSEVSYALALPSSPVFLFSSGIAPACLDLSDGVVYSVRVDDGTRTEVVFNTAYVPGPATEQRTWIDQSVDLSGWANKNVTLTLRTEPGPAHNFTCDWAVWAEPTIASYH